MFRILRALIDPIVTIVLAPWLLSRLRHPSDLQRAQMIETVAVALAAQLVIEYPTSPLADLVNQLVTRLAAAIPPGFRTSNEDVYKRAASAALLDAAKKLKESGR